MNKTKQDIHKMCSHKSKDSSDQKCVFEILRDWENLNIRNTNNFCLTLNPPTLHLKPKDVRDIETPGSGFGTLYLGIKFWSEIKAHVKVYVTHGNWS